jgi:hypothetical protein
MINLGLRKHETSQVLVGSGEELLVSIPITACHQCQYLRLEIDVLVFQKDVH